MAWIRVTCPDGTVVSSYIEDAPGFDFGQDEVATAYGLDPKAVADILAQVKEEQG